MNLELLSFGLAVLLGLMAFALVKHTADEFDRWYDAEARPVRRLRLPVALVSLAVAFVAASFLFH